MKHVVGKIYFYNPTKAMIDFGCFKGNLKDEIKFLKGYKVIVKRIESRCVIGDFVNDYYRGGMFAPECLVPYKENKTSFICINPRNKPNETD